MKAILQQYLLYKTNLTIQAKEILGVINDIRPIRGYKYLRVKNIDKDYIEFYGEETWDYGGHEDYYFDIPANLLYDKIELEKYLKSLKTKNEKDKLLEEQIKQKEIDRKRELLYQLKKELEV